MATYLQWEEFSSLQSEIVRSVIKGLDSLLCWEPCPEYHQSARELFRQNGREVLNGAAPLGGHAVAEYLVTKLCPLGSLKH
jgi:hypothetical protein